MIRDSFVRALLAASLIITISGAVTDQDGAIGPEGERWDLMAYGVDGQVTTGPLVLWATASGSGRSGRP
jgi:hypothetical protein